MLCCSDNKLGQAIDSVYLFHQPLLEVLGLFLSYSLPFLHLDHKGKQNGLCHLEQHKYVHAYSTDRHTVLSSTMLQCGILQYNLCTVCSMYVYTVSILEHYTCTYVRIRYTVYIYVGCAGVFSCPLCPPTPSIENYWWWSNCGTVAMLGTSSPTKWIYIK